MKIVVSRNELLAALIFASEDDSRYVLNGVFIEARPGHRPTLISMDGRRLSVIQSVAEQVEDFEEMHSLLLRPDFVKAVCSLSKAVGDKTFPWICFQNTPESKAVVVSFIGRKCILNVEDGALLDGEYPAWRAVVPAKDKERAAISELGLNAEFMGDFAKAAKALESESQVIRMNLVADGGAIEVMISGVSNFYGLIMPCKIEDEVNYQPEFLGLDLDRGSAVIQKPAKDDGVTVTIATDGMAPVTVPLGAFKNAAERVQKEKIDCGEDESMIEQCIEVIRTEQKATVSLLQRRVRLGYTRAFHIMDELERRGIVGPAKGSEPRDILR